MPKDMLKGFEKTLLQPKNVVLQTDQNRRANDRNTANVSNTGDEYLTGRIDKFTNLISQKKPIEFL